MTTPKGRTLRLSSHAFLTLAVVFLSCLGAAVQGQDLPGKIRGYKVYNTKVVVVTAGATTPDENPGVIVKVGEPRVADVGLYGATIEFGAEFTTAKHSGAVDFLTFRDFRIHDIPVDIVEYSHPFQFRKQQLVVIPQPVQVTFSVLSLPKAVYQELIDSRDDLIVTGTVFVFGRFKKMGFTFKRVVPIKIDIKIKNPLRTT
jgi:hypothetical protein